jgi:glycerate 2-kinase
LVVKNKAQLIRNAENERDREARRIALELIEASLASASPEEAVRRHVKLKKNLLLVDGLQLDLNKCKNIYVVGGGKASGGLAEAVEKILGDRISGGVVNILRGTKDRYKVERIELNEASHPIPDEAGESGARRMLRLVGDAKKGDLVICLISGGGSALMPVPAGKITLPEKQQITMALVRGSPATINEINSVRKHISAFKGGQLAKAAYPATIVSLILSDVVGDPLDVIASGPTSPDTTTFSDATNVLRKYNLWDRAPQSVRDHLALGGEGMIPETPKPGEEIFSNVKNVVVGSNLIACKAAYSRAKEIGLNPLLLSTRVEGEAREVGKVLAAVAAELASTDHPVKRPAAVIAGGETTVTLVERPGLGGRNTELALSASRTLLGRAGIALAAVGTDGLDGPTDAAGALVDGTTIARGERTGLRAEAFLGRNAPYEYFKSLGDLVVTGPTGTNVNDVYLLVVV